MKKGVIVLLLMMVAVHFNVLAKVWEADSLDLHPKEHYSREASLMVQILNAYHFKKITLNDSLSSIILDEYLQALDNNHSYFLKSDIEGFEKYRTRLDDLSSLGEIDFAFEIYNVFRQRFNQRMSYVRNVLFDKSYDYTIDEFYNTDRSEMPWANDEKELNELWRKVIKSQVLNLRLNGKEDGDIRETMEKRYRRFQKNIDQYTSEDVFELYMNTLAETYDPHTNYFSPRTSDRFRQNMSLSLEGIGARLMTENDFTKVAQVMPGGPAEKSKSLQENDLIVGVAQGVDGEMVDVIGWRIDDVVQLIKGPKGTTVRLEILAAETGVKGPSKEITLVREKIKIEDMEAKSEIINFEKDGRPYRVGVITLPGFYMDFEAYQNGDPDYNSTTRDVKRLVLELNEQGIDGLMMDLRNNGGGSLAEAIDLTGLFIKDGPVVQIKTSSNKIEVGEDEDPDVIYDGPLSVMINRFSASASEIFAGAIQDYQRGVVIGEQTFGKGTVQSVIDLNKYIDVPDGGKVGQLKLTLQKFYRVTGSSTQHLGVSPDIDLPSAFEASEFGESANPSALPWDQIGSARYNLTSDVSPELISELNNSYESRLLNDLELKELVTQANELKQNLAKTTISLNEKKRKEEMEASKVNEVTNKNLSGNTIDTENKVSSGLQVNDQYLKEGIIILSNMIQSIG
ncbi:tail-specific protease [Fulvivirga sp. M361]|uniref:carboxy terminal-processing peptidase n=1 Tax=Fulvivirga sp. M361 TaxID=2594266 RepID=UPI00117B2099|nr:carboxy terminal-processing peptidase [Fulvivirga sp. M361]TRX59582.1 tail-specific protease [Fulvivirga sp. M361]